MLPIAYMKIISLFNLLRVYNLNYLIERLLIYIVIHSLTHLLYHYTHTLYTLNINYFRYILSQYYLNTTLYSNQLHILLLKSTPKFYTKNAKLNIYNINIMNKCLKDKLIIIKYDKIFMGNIAITGYKRGPI